MEGSPQQDPVHGHASPHDEHRRTPIASEEHHANLRQSHAAHREENAYDLHTQEAA